MKVNLGCGSDVRPGYVNVDTVRLPGVDVIHDLNEPLPFTTNTVDTVVCLNVIEHIRDVESFIREVHRVLKPGGWAEIVTPHFSHADAWTDPQHVHAFGAFTADYWQEDNERNYYLGVGFKEVAVWVEWFHKWYFPHHYLFTVLGRSRKFLLLYEAVLHGWFPAHSIQWILTKGE